MRPPTRTGPPPRWPTSWPCPARPRSGCRPPTGAPWRPPGRAAGPALGRSDVVLVTGGARGVTAEVAVALAEVYQPTLILTGRTPAPAGPEPDWSSGLSDEATLKKAIAQHLGGSATPKAVGDF